MSKSDPSHPQPARPIEMEDWLNANLYHPLSYRLALPLQSTIISPNVLSIAGGLMVIAAATVYFNLPGLVGGVLGLLFHMTWHVLDGADGDLARLTGRSSALGEIIDGACDYIGHLVLYVTLAVIVAVEFGWIGAALVMAAALARAAQTIFFETQRRQYQFWVYDAPWLRVTTASNGPSAMHMFEWPARIYLRFSMALGAKGERLDAVLDQMGPDERIGAKALIKRRMRPLIGRLSILSSNYRTLMIGGAMMMSEPIIIVIFELFVLTIVWLFFWQQARRDIASLADQLSAKTLR